MSDLVKRLRASRAVWEDARGVPTDLEREAADRIEELEDRLSVAEKSLQQIAKMEQKGGKSAGLRVTIMGRIASAALTK